MPKIALLNYVGIIKVINPLPSPYPTQTYQNRPADINVPVWDRKGIRMLWLGGYWLEGESCMLIHK